jgi:hypothetical protein
MHLGYQGIHGFYHRLPRLGYQGRKISDQYKKISGEQESAAPLSCKAESLVPLLV